MADQIYFQELEHLFSPNLWKNVDFKTALEAAGLTAQMNANKKLLYQNAQTVADIQGAPEGFQKSLQDGGASTVRHQGNAAGGNQFGTATYNDHEELGITQEEYQAWQAAGFYAVSYDTPDYGTVISYRGTDNFSWPNADQGGNDVINGWTTALGERRAA